jgi:hydroxymethylpyrimidine/phosphomethylpyrimidine kinase / thiaminase
LDDLDIKAIKTGMLYDANTIRATAEKLRVHYHGSKVAFPPIVCDPVSVSTSGHTLLAPDAMQVLIDELIPLATVITPNKHEAELLLSCRGLPSSINTVEDMLLASSNLVSLGSRAVLLKGGHIKTTLAEIEHLSISHPQVLIIKDGLLDDNMEILQLDRPESSPELVVDVLQHSSADGDGYKTTTLFVRPRINSTNTHGTGCTLSAAITCGLAKNLSCGFLPRPLKLLI